MSKTEFPDIWTIWVMREKPCFIGSKDSEAAAIDFGNRTVSTKDFVIKRYSVIGSIPKLAAEVVVKKEDNPIELDNLPPPDMSY